MIARPARRFANLTQVLAEATTAAPTNMSLPTDLIEQLDGWVNDLATLLMPPRLVPEGSDLIRLEFRAHVPHAVMIGKLVRAVSGLRAALVLAEAGFLAECAGLLRMVSDFCTEVVAIGEALRRGGEPPRAVRDFIDQYFTPKARTVSEYAAREHTRYVSREELMKGVVRLAEGTVDGEWLRSVHQFLNMSYDAYVHGAYETAMELCNPSTGVFAMRGHPAAAKRQEFVEAVFLKMHEVLVAVEITAAVTAHAPVFKAAREARHVMDTSEPWRWQNAEPPAGGGG